MTAFVANTNVIELLGLKSEIDDTFLNNATVTVTIKDSNGDDVAGVTWPVSMDYVATSDGDYRGILSDEIVLLHKKKYRAFIEVDAGTDKIGHWEFPFQPITRTGVPDD